MSRTRQGARVQVLGSRTHCEICEARFQLLINQEHHCKRCLRVVCDKCFSGRAKVYTPDGSASQIKVCVCCLKEEDFAAQLIAQHALVFRTSSQLAEEWLRKQNKEKLSFEAVINEYEEMKCRRVSRTGPWQGRCESPSLRQFVGRMTEGLRAQSVAESTGNVVLALQGYLKEVRERPQLWQLVQFLLCFANESQCYFILSRFLERTFPQYMRYEGHKDFPEDSRTLSEMYQVLLKDSPRPEPRLLPVFLQQAFLPLVFSLGCLCALPVAVHLLDETLSRNSYIVLFEGIVALAFLARPLLQGSHDGPSLMQLVRTVPLEKLKNTMVFFERAGTKFEMAHQFFDSPEHRRLYEKYRLLEQVQQQGQDKNRQLEARIAELTQLLTVREQQLATSEQKVVQLQEDLLALSDKVVLLEEVAWLRQRSAELEVRNEQLQLKLGQAETELEQQAARYAQEEITRKMYLRLQHDYEEEVAELRTRIEVLEAEQMASGVDFDTAYLDAKFAEKNRAIAALTQEKSHLAHEVDFLRNWRATRLASADSFAASLSTILSEAGRQMQVQLPATPPKALRALIEASRELVKGLKLQLAETRQKTQSLEAEVARLGLRNQELQGQLSLLSLINESLSQVPEEHDYLGSLQQMRALAEQEQGLHRRSQLQAVAESFQKCLHEVRYRTIDSRLKENRIRQLSSSHSEEGLPSATSRDISFGLRWLGNQKDIKEINQQVLGKEESCIVM